MRVRHPEAAGPPIINSRARLVTVKTPRTARPRRRRADGLDGANDEPPMAIVGGPPEEWPRRGCEIAPRNTASISASSAPAILVTIGQQTRIFHAFVTSAPPVLDAPATVTLFASTLADVAAFASPEFTVEQNTAHSPGRLVLVDAMELTWQRAKYREGNHRLTPVDAGLVGLTVLQRWLWRRLQLSDDPGTRCVESPRGTQERTDRFQLFRSFSE